MRKYEDVAEREDGDDRALEVEAAGKFAVGGEQEKVTAGAEPEARERIEPAGDRWWVRIEKGWDLGWILCQFVANEMWERIPVVRAGHAISIFRQGRNGVGGKRTFESMPEVADRGDCLGNVDGHLNLCLRGEFLSEDISRNSRGGGLELPQAVERLQRNPAIHGICTGILKLRESEVTSVANHLPGTFFRPLECLASGTRGLFGCRELGFA
jgi:hypothetical protein